MAFTHETETGLSFLFPSLHRCELLRRGAFAARLLGRFRAHRTRVGDEVPRHSGSRQPARLHAAAVGARPHHVGSPYDKDNAEWMLAKLKEWGLDAHIENFDVLFPTPKERAAGTGRAARTSPPSSRSRRSPATPPPRSTTSSFPPTTPTRSMATSPAPLVYVNYGVPDDYDNARPPGHLGEGRHRHRALRRHPGAASSPRWRPSTAPSAA